jgi:hypothetical protein
MPSPVSLAALLAGLTPRFNFAKVSQAAEGAGAFHSLWKAAGNPPAGANPPAFGSGAGYVPTNATPGSFPLPNAGGGLDSYLARFGAGGSVAGSLILYDRLWACSGLSANVNTLQSIVTPGDAGAGRIASFAQVELWGEVYGAPGATAGTWTVGYTNQADTAGRSATYAHPANAETVGQMFPFVLATGDRGVKSVQSLQLSAASGSPGDIGLTLLRRVAELPLTVPNVAYIQDALETALPEIVDDACLALMVMCSTTTTGYITGSVAATVT